jgi:uncharacterized membrane protein YagU involved in acid resistance
MGEGAVVGQAITLLFHFVLFPFFPCHTLSFYRVVKGVN